MALCHCGLFDLWEKEFEHPLIFCVNSVWSCAAPFSLPRRPGISASSFRGRRIFVQEASYLAIGMCNSYRNRMWVEGISVAFTNAGDFLVFLQDAHFCVVRSVTVCDRTFFGSRRCTLPQWLQSDNSCWSVKNTCLTCLWMNSQAYEELTCSKTRGKLWMSLIWKWFSEVGSEPKFMPTWSQMPDP